MIVLKRAMNNNQAADIRFSHNVPGTSNHFRK